MQTLITIPSGIKDPTYRYKMPKMLLKEESRLNGVKTNIVNIEEVALALRVPSISIMKFMSSELGANMEQTSIVKGKHSYDVMLKHLDKFIEKYFPKVFDFFLKSIQIFRNSPDMHVIILFSSKGFR